MTKILNDKERKHLFTGVLLLGRAFVELGAKSGLDSEQGYKICEMAASVASSTAGLLGYDHIEARIITEKVYKMVDSSDGKELSDKEVEDYYDDNGPEAQEVIWIGCLQD